MIVYMFFLSPYEKAKKIKYQKPKNMSFFLHKQKKNPKNEYIVYKFCFVRLEDVKFSA